MPVWRAAPANGDAPCHPGMESRIGSVPNAARFVPRGTNGRVLRQRLPTLDGIRDSCVPRQVRLERRHGGSMRRIVLLAIVLVTANACQPTDQVTANGEKQFLGPLGGDAAGVYVLRSVAGKALPAVIASH